MAALVSYGSTKPSPRTPPTLGSSGHHSLRPSPTCSLTSSSAFGIQTRCALLGCTLTSLETRRLLGTARVGNTPREKAARDEPRPRPRSAESWQMELLAQSLQESSPGH